MEELTTQICDYTLNIWDSILGLEVSQDTAPFKPNGESSTLAGCVHIMGAWEGTIALKCPKALARKIASIMFRVPEDDADGELIQDALGEMTNMTGGNLKALLPAPCTLSLPAVAVTDYNFRVPGTTLVTEVTFKCQDQPFAVTVLQKTGNGESS